MRTIATRVSATGLATESAIARYPDDELTVAVLANLAEAKPGDIAEHVAEMYLSGKVALSSGNSRMLTAQRSRFFQIPIFFHCARPPLFRPNVSPRS